MSTRSNIGLKRKDGSVDVVYCHWDGYLSNNGSILLDNYKLEGVEYIVASGDMSSLGYTSYDCRFYEDTSPARHYNSIEEYYDAVKEDIFIEYAYIFDEESSSWLVAFYEESDDGNYSFGEFQPLTRELIEREG